MPLSHIIHKPSCVMEGVSSLQKNLQSLPARVPKIVVPRIDELFPALKESMVSVLCFCA
jgi:hypothetical protein